MKFILASGSPRRYEILKNLGLSFDVLKTDADETSDLSDPCALTEELARRKGAAALGLPGVSPDDVIISCDTVVECCGKILGKPRDEADAARMLRLLSGRTHRVVSGICVHRGDRYVTAHEVTEVTFSELSDADVDLCVKLGAPCDKAGAYAIQGTASLFIKGIRGDYFNVVGLPVNLLYRTLASEFAINLGDHLEKEN